MNVFTINLSGDGLERASAADEKKISPRRPCAVVGGFNFVRRVTTPDELREEKKSAEEADKKGEKILLAREWAREEKTEGSDEELLERYKCRGVPPAWQSPTEWVGRDGGGLTSAAFGVSGARIPRLPDLREDAAAALGLPELIRANEKKEKLKKLLLKEEGYGGDEYLGRIAWRDLPEEVLERFEDLTGFGKSPSSSVLEDVQKWNKRAKELLVELEVALYPNGRLNQ